MHVRLVGAPPDARKNDTGVTALARIAEGESAEARVFCPRPAQELGELLSFLEAAVGLGVQVTDLTIVTPHPCRSWLETLEARAFGRAGLEVRSSPDGDPVGTWTVSAALAAICPLLHLKGEEGVELSVCGAHANRMLVAATQMARWCMADHRYCPHKIRSLKEDR
jgi:hypothetical protein